MAEQSNIYRQSVFDGYAINARILRLYSINPNDIKGRPMPLDLLTIATTAVTVFLVPFAKAGLEKITESFTKSLGEKTADYVTDITGKVWSTVTSAFQSSKEQTTLELFKENPEEMQELLIKKLHEKMSQDATFAQSVADLLNKPGPDGTTTGAQIMQAGIAGIVDLRNANLAQAQNLTIAGVIHGDPLVDTGNPKRNG